MLLPEYTLYAAAFNPKADAGYTAFTGCSSFERSGVMFPQISAGTACYDAERKILYCTSERRSSADGAGEIWALRADPAGGMLTELNHTHSFGPAPSGAAFDPEKKWLAVSHFGPVKAAGPACPESGKYYMPCTCLFRLNEDGSIGALCSSFVHETENGRSAHAHMVKYSPSGRYFIVTDMGTDKICSFTVDNNSGKLCIAAVYQCPAGSGPRYCAFSPDGQYLYVNFEDGLTVSSFRVSENGSLTLLHTLALQAPGDPADLLSGLALHPDGSILYTVMRGQNKAYVIQIDRETQKLTLVQEYALKGRRPKDCCVSPDGKLLAIANRDSGDIELCDIDQGGMLSAKCLLPLDRAGFSIFIPGADTQT